ncbi:MAG TPA: Rieske 2Fe-2S domain-containing protein [Dehalococcoidia bacterium]|nr:Rieske 2Fe-2S domain-containing protein [Dehalococcoidia bacterium]
MLTKEENEILCRVGPGTLMGNLLRRYWTPVMLSNEIPEPDSPPVRVRILGEDLIAFRDTNGDVGLFANSCPHRGASMFFGRNEEAGLRCVYHGWKFDTSGACVDMPSEPAESNFKTKVRIGAYPVHESGGLVWAYLGPADKKPGFRDFGSESMPKEQWQAFKATALCNWVQRNEGQIDSSHISWLHQYFGAYDYADDGTDRPGYPSFDMSIKIWAHDRAPRLELHNEWYGYRYAAHRTTPNGHDHVRITAYVPPYTTMVANIPWASGGVHCVPVDDYKCFFFFGARNRTEADQIGLRLAGVEGKQLFDNTPYRRPLDQGQLENRNGKRRFLPENDYLIDRELQQSTFYTGITDFGSQDLMATESMGPIYDRTQEHLGTTDKAIIRMRQILITAAKDLAKGIEPPCLDASLPYHEIRSGEKILAPGEDWRIVGSNDDPLLLQAQRMAQELRQEVALPGGGA